MNPICLSIHFTKSSKRGVMVTECGVFYTNDHWLFKKDSCDPADEYGIPLPVDDISKPDASATIRSSVDGHSFIAGDPVPEIAVWGASPIVLPGDKIGAWIDQAWAEFLSMDGAFFFVRAGGFSEHNPVIVAASKRWDGSADSRHFVGLIMQRNEPRIGEKRFKKAARVFAKVGSE